MAPRIIHRLGRPQLHFPQRRLLTTAHPHVQPPPTAPKPVINLKSIRENPEVHAQNCLDRNYTALSGYPARIVELYDEWAGLQKSLRGDRERANALSDAVRKAAKADKAELVKEAQLLKAKIGTVEVKERELERDMKELALALPNSTHPESPVGTEPSILDYINPDNAPRKVDPAEVISHTQIGVELKLMDFADAGVVSGWGWYYLHNEAVLLEQALVNYALSLARKNGWMLVTPPSIVYSHMAAACGFRPRDQNGEQQIYLLNEGQHALAGTAEIPLAGMHANKTFGLEDLPMKMVGVGRAYRAEAGARGVDSKGLYRVHEFTKVELFAWAPPPLAHHEERQHPTADDIFNEMLQLQKTFLSSLGLHARILEMPTTDLGASASRKIDIEAYMPSRAHKDPWGEVSSLSNCTDYQSRRLNTRIKLDGGSGKKTVFPYTLNGTACAVPRVLIAILENGWDGAKGGVVVPEVLRPFMGGIDFIGKKK
ncbi:hypothetical protein FN846DRAFT_809685 [Sphaerosporella brunnea]|uniref:serine--tRNA ligase n=1 Tax=Sphaerosporella brunnea TaxID=1250544 RepID=A0A5J5F3A5_9PEZI|nr:hypothetical protein FN846DRAFT_809685 [Sphaerosporella brunnea]